MNDEICRQKKMNVSFELQAQTINCFIVHICIFILGFSKPFNIYVHTDSLEGSSAPAESLNRLGSTKRKVEGIQLYA